MGSLTYNGKVLFDRPSIRPRNYTDMIQMTRDLKNELKYQLEIIRQDKINKEEDEVIRIRDMEFQETQGFSRDLAYGMGGQIVNYLK